MKTKLQRLCTVMLASLVWIVSSCSWNWSSDPQNAPQTAGGHGMIVLGKQLQDPYSVKNMTKALSSLYPTKAATVGSLDPTHTYVRFRPANEDELETLTQLGVQILDHPMDYEILREGDWYHDPSVPEGDITWQYAALPVGCEIPKGIVYEKLDDCFIVSEEQAQTKAGGIDWAAVERESFRLTGNSDILTKGGEENSRPQGRITIMDEDYDSEPVGVSGVKVSCNVFVKFAHAFTDEEGYYEMDRSFSSAPRYRLVFVNKKGFFLGLNAVLAKGSVSSLGKQPASGCTLTIDRGTDDSMFERCAVNNAAWSYYESCTVSGLKMKAPPANLCIWTFRKLSTSACVMLHHGAITGNELTSSLVGEYLPVVEMFLPDIILGLDSKRSYADIFALTTHHLAHASHFMIAGTSYWDAYLEFLLSSYATSGGLLYGVGSEKNAGYCEIAEMWAFYMQTILFGERYPDNSTTFGTSYWFSPQILLYLSDRGLGRFSVFSALSADVHDRETLRTRLLSYYPEFKNEINQAFNRYI